MKKLWIALFSLWATVAQANVPCTLPFNLQNATLADATQVMANYNAIVTCLTNAARAGANTDITSLGGLTTALTPAQGGSTVFIGGADTGGDGNTHVLTFPTPANFLLSAGNQVTWIPSLTNNGPSTLNVAGTGVLPVFRRTQLGVSATVGGEIINGHPTTVAYDGTRYVLVSTGPYLVGEQRDFSGPAAPAGWAIIDGSCQLRAGNFADLFLVIGTTYDPTGSTCDVVHFALPDGRGRVMAGKDTTTTRITVAASGCNGNILGGAGCGLQAQTVNQANLPNVNFTVSDPGHFHSVQAAFALIGQNGSAVSSFTGAGVSTGTSQTGISVNSGGSGTLLPTLPPLQVVTKIIKF